MSRPPANKPKPNTRFLRNIIKDTDSHNAALLAKEAADSKARLQELSGKNKREERPRPVSGVDVRRRQLGDIAAILGGAPKKRKRVEEEAPKQEKPRKRNTSNGENDEPEHSRDERSRKRNSRDEEKEESQSSRSHRSHHHRRERSISPDREKDRERRRKDRSRSRSPKRDRREKESRHRDRSPRRKHSRSPAADDKDKSHRSHRRRSTPEIWSSSRRKESEKVSKRPEPEVDDDSDPLDEIIGPRPPPVSEIRSRGRGTISGASGMDSRFSKGYDPTVDVQLDVDEENDWEQALEALKDRQKWKQQGADRLRAAGFTEDEVKKWETGGEKREEDVKWAKKGEGREWDRGKVVDDEGVVSFDPKFGRLTDS